MEQWAASRDIWYGGMGGQRHPGSWVKLAARSNGCSNLTHVVPGTFMTSKAV